MSDPELWIARDDKQAPTDSDIEDHQIWLYTKKPRGFRVLMSKRVTFDQQKGHAINLGERFCDDIGLDLKPGECKEFKLIQVNENTVQKSKE